MNFMQCYGCMRRLQTAGEVCRCCGYDNTGGPARQPDHVLPCGTVLDGHFVVGRMLGQGGFGITYIGYDLNLEVRVCIKEYYPKGSALRFAEVSRQVHWANTEDGQSMKNSRENLVREARKAVRVRDISHVVSVWDVFYENETAYIVMDYIEGETLMHCLTRTRRNLGEEECIDLLAPVMQDLETIHARGIIHRDIKPDNLMLREDGVPILLDMGAAKDLGRGTATAASSTLVVSQGFSPIEQYTQTGKIGPWTDVYAMCATICYCLTGKRLPTPMERASGEEPDLTLVSPRLRQVLAKGLALRPQDRIQSMGELLEALRGALTTAPPKTPKPPKTQEPPKTPKPPKTQEPPKTPNTPNTPNTPKPPKRPKKWLAILFTALALLAALGRAAEKQARQHIHTPAPTAQVSAAPTPTPKVPDFSDIAEAVVGQAAAESTPTPTPKVPDFSDIAEAFVEQAVAESTPTPTPTVKPTQEPRVYTGSIAQISCGYKHTVMLRKDGTVTAAGSKTFGRCDVSGWRNITAVSAGFDHTLGLRADGTAVACGYNLNGQCDVGGWTDLTAVSAGQDHSVGLKADGSVVAVGSNSYGQCDVSGWKDIIAVSAGYGYTLGLKADGSVVAVGSNNYGQCDVSGWKDIVAIEAGDMYSAGLRAAGYVVTTVQEYKPTADWVKITKIASSGKHTVGLRRNGGVYAAGYNGYGQCEVSDWRDIVDIAAGSNYTIGLRADGVLLVAGDNADGQCDLESEDGIIYMETAVSTSAERP